MLELQRFGSKLDEIYKENHVKLDDFKKEELFRIQVKEKENGSVELINNNEILQFIPHMEVSIDKVLSILVTKNDTKVIAFSPEQIKELQSAIEKDFDLHSAERTFSDSRHDELKQLKNHLCRQLVPALADSITKSPYFQYIKNHPEVRNTFFDSNGNVKMTGRRKYADNIDGPSSPDKIKDILMKCFPNEYKSGKIVFADKDIEEQVYKIIEKYREEGKSGLETYAFVHPISEDYIFGVNHLTAIILAMEGDKKYLMNIDSFAGRSDGMFKSAIKSDFSNLTELEILKLVFSRVITQEVDGGCGVHAIIDAVTYLKDKDIIKKIENQLSFDENERYVKLKAVRIFIKLNKAIKEEDCERADHLEKKLFEYLIYIGAMKFTREEVRKDEAVSIEKLGRLFDKGSEILRIYLLYVMSLTNKYGDIDISIEKRELFLREMFRDKSKLKHVKDILSGINSANHFRKSGQEPNMEEKFIKTGKLLKDINMSFSPMITHAGYKACCEVDMMI